MSILWVFIGSVVVLYALEFWLRVRFVIESHKNDGKRQALQEVRALIRTKSDVAVELAPVGRLNEGLVRARVLDELFLEISELE